VPYNILSIVELEIKEPVEVMVDYRVSEIIAKSTRDSKENLELVKSSLDRDS
jgi:hypothetical protein